MRQPKLDKDCLADRLGHSLTEILQTDLVLHPVAVTHRDVADVNLIVTA